MCHKISSFHDIHVHTDLFSQTYDVVTKYKLAVNLFTIWRKKGIVWFYNNYNFFIILFNNICINKIIAKINKLLFVRQVTFLLVELSILEIIIITDIFT